MLNSDALQAAHNSIIGIVYSAAHEVEAAALSLKLITALPKLGGVRG